VPVELHLVHFRQILAVLQFFQLLLRQVAVEEAVDVDLVYLLILFHQEDQEEVVVQVDGHKRLAQEIHHQLVHRKVIREEQELQQAEVHQVEVEAHQHQARRQVVEMLDQEDQVLLIQFQVHQ
jgi:hypothetical protein